MISFLVVFYSERRGSKGPYILQTEIEERTDMTSFQTKSGRSEVCLSSFRQFETAHQANFLEEFVLAPKHL